MTTSQFNLLQILWNANRYRDIPYTLQMPYQFFMDLVPSLPTISKAGKSLSGVRHVLR
ncbi:hypothetical protein PISMIDRAFT_674659 [Pisolithus microcarpus 441]|uniref:Uncharacterized protein n=1 Tax=Pisolithus microcarpus 441 TaxID=765257 RepID=A0A0C9ZEI3_9AGAM|nr:hypothetical protein PISMIDRAFT_674659 [Pisolithus microcarpus 441]